MNAQPQLVEVISFEINPKLDPEKMYEDFRKTGRLRIRNFLDGRSANEIYQHLTHDVQWRTFLVANENLMGTSPGEPLATRPEDETEILDMAYEGARSNFACVFDADRLYSEDLADAISSEGSPAAGDHMEPASSPILGPFESFLASTRVVEFLRRVSGITAVDGLNVQSHAIRFRRGHFMTFHAGTWSADTTGKRRAAFYLNLTPEWRPEWGGMLEFRTAEADNVEAFMPSFNTLDLFAFPQGHWISPVAPFAGGPVLAITGRVYVP